MGKILNLMALAVVNCYSAFAQGTPMLITSSYTLVQGFAIAPGQLVTLVVDMGFPSGVYKTVRAPANADLPVSLAGITGGYAQIPKVTGPSPILEIHPYFGLCSPVLVGLCTPLAAITIQIPFEAANCASGCVAYAAIGFSLGDSLGTSANVAIVPYQVHLLTTCDAFMIPELTSATGNGTGLPCPSVVAHGNGSAVSAENPALPGEEVVAYAVGLGQTDPPLQTGKVATGPARTQATFGLDFNYHPNAVASKPLPNAPPPIYSGATPGCVGLYQINLAVPSPPLGTPPCVVPKTPGENVVYSNLTVSVGGASSFDAARLCVAVNP